MSSVLIILLGFAIGMLFVWAVMVQGVEKKIKTLTTPPPPPAKQLPAPPWAGVHSARARVQLAAKYPVLDRRRVTRTSFNTQRGLL